MRFLFPILISSILCLGSDPARCAGRHSTLEDLKKLDIICFVPSWLPKGFRINSLIITYDEPGPDEDHAGRFPLYSIEYGNRAGQTFSIDSAREGIGDRNLLDTDDSEDAEIPSPFGRMFIIYTPKANGAAGRKAEIKSNWTSDANMLREKAKDPLTHPTLGRYHGFSASGIALAEFKKIINSLHPIQPR